MDNYSLLGLALITTQRVEFLTLGIISHFKDIDSDKRFRKLTPDTFLGDSPEDKKTRRQTLGQIFSLLKKEKSLAISDRLDEYLAERNVLVHHFWRDFVKNNKLGIEDPNVKKFCLDFISLSQKIEKFYKGFLYSMAQSIEIKTSKVIPANIQNFKEDQVYFLECLESNDFI